MKFLARYSISFLIAACISVSASADEANGRAPSSLITESKTIHVDLQPWQQRRKDFIKIIQGLREGNPTAQKDFDAVLTEFEKNPYSRTPMENMEILGVFYVPREGVEAAFSVIVANAVLGWYDGLRFASESGRAEIINNEGFFKKAIVLGGPDVTAKAIKFLEGNTERKTQLLTQGISFAEKFRNVSEYDRQWPTAYGLERIICAQGGACITPKPMPKEQWDKAWEEAKQRVTLYYQPVKPNAASDNSTQRTVK